MNAIERERERIWYVLKDRTWCNISPGAVKCVSSTVRLMREVYGKFRHDDDHFLVEEHTAYCSCWLHCLLSSCPTPSERVFGDETGCCNCITGWEFLRMRVFVVVLCVCGFCWCCCLTRCSCFEPRYCFQFTGHHTRFHLKSQSLN
jgi:hypothetical protein